MFIDKICNISSLYDSYDVNGEPNEVSTPIYVGINCDFYKDTKNKYKNDGFTVKGKDYAYTVVLDGDKVLVELGQIIELIDPTLGTYGDFIIDDVLVFRNTNGLIDNYELKVSEKKK